MRKIIISLFIFFSLAISLNLVAGKSTNLNSFDFSSGYIIIESPQENLKQLTDYQYNFFLYNDSDGILLDNSSIYCTFYLANKTGGVILFQNATYFSDDHWGIDINKNNFSDLGAYAYGVSCQNVNFGGALSGFFDVTREGNAPITEAQGIIIGISIFSIMLIGLFFIVLSLGIKNPVVKIVMLGFAAIFLIIIMLYTSVIIDQTLGSYNDLVSGYGIFLFVMRFVLLIATLTIIIFAGLIGLRLWKIKRGLIG